MSRLPPTDDNSIDAPSTFPRCDCPFDDLAGITFHNHIYLIAIGIIVWAYHALFLNSS